MPDVIGVEGPDNSLATSVSTTVPIIATTVPALATTVAPTVTPSVTP